MKAENKTLIANPTPEMIENIGIDLTWFMRCIMRPLNEKHNGAFPLTLEDINQDLSDTDRFDYENNYLHIKIYFITRDAYGIVVSFTDLYPREIFDITVAGTMDILQDASKSIIKIEEEDKRISIHYNVTKEFPKETITEQTEEPQKSISELFDSTLQFLFMSLLDRTENQVYPHIKEYEIQNNGEVFYYKDEYFNGTFMFDEANERFEVDLVMSTEIDEIIRKGVCGDTQGKSEFFLGSNVKVKFSEDYTKINIKYCS